MAPDEIQDAATDVALRVEDWLLWHSEVLGWEDRYTPDLTPGEQKWLDANHPIYAERYRKSREALIAAGRLMLEAAGELRIEVPVLKELLAEVISEVYPTHSLDGWDSRVSEIAVESSRVAIAAFERDGSKRADARTPTQPSASEANKDWASITEAALSLDLNKSTISKLCDRGVVRAEGNGRNRRVDMNSLAAYKRRLDADRF